MIEYSACGRYFSDGTTFHGHKIWWLRWWSGGVYDRLDGELSASNVVVDDGRAAAEDGSSFGSGGEPALERGGNQD